MTAGLVAAAVVGLVVTGGSLAQSGDSDDRLAAEPPPASAVSYCPTPQQATTHLQQSGSDYKPSVTCTVNGPVDPHQVGERGNAPAPPTAAEMCLQARSAKPLPNTDGDPLTVEGQLPDGSVTRMEIMGDPRILAGKTINDVARGLCP